MKKKILLLPASIGSGHYRSAEALKKAILQLDENSDVKIVDFLECVNPVLRRIATRTYLEMIEIAPKIYDTAFSWTGDSTILPEFKGLLGRVGDKRLQDLVDEYQPDIIVGIHFFSVASISNLKESQKITPKTVAVNTDFVVHPIWAHRNIDLYIVASDVLAEELARHGAPREKIVPAGIPIDHDIWKYRSKKQSRKKLGLSVDLPTILIMGGGLGMGVVESFKKIRNFPTSIQIICVAGKNKELFEKLQKLSAKSKHPVLLYSYIDFIDVVMSAADLLISKPGGMTISEALALGLPLIIVDPLPGQEDYNTAFLTTAGAGIKVRKARGLIPVLKKALIGENLEALRRRALANARPDAAIKAGVEILDLVGAA